HVDGDAPAARAALRRRPAVRRRGRRARGGSAARDRRPRRRARGARDRPPGRGARDEGVRRDRPPLVRAAMNVAYLHGFASGPGSTKAQLFRARLAERGVELAIPDLAPDFTHMTIGSQLAIVDALLDRAPTLLCGSSLGGYLAALAAARRPERVPALLL